MMLRRKSRAREGKMVWDHLAVIKLMVAALIAVLISGCASIFIYLYVTSTNEQRLKSSLISSCEENGNSLRMGLQEEKEEELEEKRHPDIHILKALHVTEAKAIEISKPQIKKIKKRIKRYAPLECNEIFK